MGFLSALGTIAGIGAAPFTGGASLIPGILSGVSAAGDVLGGIGAGRQKGRETLAQAQLLRDREAINRYTAEENARLQAAKLQEDIEQDRADRALTAGKTRAGQAALGDILANIRPSGVSGLPGYIPKISFSGGLSPALLGPMARTAGQTLARDALLAQLTGSDVPARPDLSRLGGAAPELTELPKATGLDTFLNTIGTIGQIAGIGEEARKRRQSPVILNSRVPGILKSANLRPVEYPSG